jgi:hypothetical protein
MASFMKIRQTVRTLTPCDGWTEGHMWSPHMASLLSKERLGSVLLPFICQPVIFLCKHFTQFKFSFSTLYICLTGSARYMSFKLLNLTRYKDQCTLRVVFLKKIDDGKGKAIPLQAWTGSEGSKRLRLPDFKTINTLKW